MRSLCRLLFVLAYVLSGCGLVLDLDPDDSSSDAAVVDGATSDGAPRDGAGIDARFIDATGVDAFVPDGGPDDAGAKDSGGSDAGPINPCIDHTNGDDCSDPGSGAPLICLDEQCSISRCGDGFIDPARGEDCEDGNEVSGDGCEPFSCIWSCDDNGDCDDANPCTGPDVCDEGVHRCVHPDLASGECDPGDGSAGVCRAGVCVIPGCGDGTTDDGEECDDADNQDGDGCDVDCEYSCETDLECGDENACDGTATCDLEGHVCEDAPPPDCTPPDTCHVGMCNTDGSCTTSPIDADTDGFLVEMALCGNDCDDLDPGVYPGAPERCDGIDNDCDDMVDDDTMPALCYADVDGDGYGDDASAVSACMCPEQTITRGEDCYDASTQLAPFVRPSQIAYFPAPWCVGGDCSYDYDCNDIEERRWTAAAGSCSLLGGSCNGSGWEAGVPVCGTQGVFVECNRILNLLGIYVCSRTRTQRVQECR